MRDLDWDGYPNCRDLGGLPTPWGPTLRGRVARGPRRELLSAEGWTAAQNWGLRSVIDLRCPAEVVQLPGDPALPDDWPGGVVVRSAPVEDHDNTEFRETCFPILDSPEYWQHCLRILPGLAHEALRAVIEAEPGTLIHCGAGRDRTGMVTALLLANAGVPARVVADDYACSVRAMAGMAANSPTQDRQATWNSAETSAWVRRTKPLVLEFVDSIETHLDAVELNRGQRQDLRDLLLH